ncbi:excinuclease ABC subunit UvrC [uncultured Cetobacterium sp.]|uniref:excinuclease ABC subunit UvrC n=1 Tax=uncultured Cetobacterium sp. TaxID=527638 RepID=UPI0025EA5C94|nr:excinuclease ABC subunit UvrC [uncultured Cetobacterium sp.]
MITVFNKEIPSNPGVYLMKNNSKIIYVGKAKNLSKRVNSYFNREHSDEKTKELVKNIDDIDFIICNSEIDALILENNLIKKYSPKYNINLKDEKTYPYILITDERFPKISIIRTTKKLNQNLGDYFGPFPFGAWNLKSTISKLYKIRDCNRDMEKIYPRPCLKFYMNLCSGPCKYKNILNEYSENISDAKEILKGNTTSIIQKLEKNMTSAAENMEFEKAIMFREQKKEIENNIQKQVTEAASSIDEDIFTLILEDNKVFLCVLNVREGKILGKNFHSINLENTIFDDIIEDTIMSYYSKYPIPKNIIFEDSMANLEKDITFVFEAISKHKVSLFFPKIKSRRRELLEMGILNLKKDIENFYNKKTIVEKGLSDLYTKLNLKRFPFKIECFDISNIQGKDAVASMSVSVEGKKAKKLYRKFKITTKDTPDDFAMMREVIERRYSKLPVEEFPDTILIDGGLGQINAVGQILEDIGKGGISELLSIAKKEEEIYKYTENTPYIFLKSDEALKILQRVRDEAHRFGVTYHRLLRNKRVISSQLDNIPGIGPKRKEILLKTFGSVKQIQNATLEELEKVIPKQLALKIKEMI